MLKKLGNCSSIEEVIERNTGLKSDAFLAVSRDPYIKNLKEAVAYFKINSKLPIYIVGDFDVDGIFATSIIFHGCRMCGIRATTRLPHRFSEGFGLSEKIIEEIDSGLIITVDNGISAHAAIKKAKEKGLLVIVMDHHLAPKDESGNTILPEADIIIDPAVDTESHFHHYCGAAIAYRFVKELIPDLDLTDLLVMASIATVTDMVPLYGANRFLVKEGLKAINAGRGVPGLRSLLKACNLTEHIVEDDFGFKIGPICNASGRIYDDGAEHVLAVMNAAPDDPILFNVGNLIKTNEKRKKLVADSMKVVDLHLTGERPIVIYDPSFGEGIIGIIAGNLCESYKCPVIVFTKTENGYLKGSGRSIPGMDLKAILDTIQPFMIQYGGHEGAAGLSIKMTQLNAFKQAFINAVGPLPDVTDDIYYDLELDIRDIKHVLHEFSKYAPYGEGNPKPKMRLKYYISPDKFRKIGDGSHFMIANNTLKLLAFSLTEKYNLLGKPSVIDCVGYLSESWFNGICSYQFQVIDFE